MHACMLCGHKLSVAVNFYRSRFFRRSLCRKCFHKQYFVCSKCGCMCYRRDASRYNKYMCIYCASERMAEWNCIEKEWNSTFNKCKSHRLFGVELETYSCPNNKKIQSKTVFGSKYDGSIRGKEYYSPPMLGDKGLEEIQNFCHAAKCRGWRVNEDCGTHVHLDVRQQTSDELKCIAIGYLLTYPSWSSLVDPRRRYNTYCAPPSLTVHDIERVPEFGIISDQANRYQFINFAAHRKHGTIEIRGLEGTLDAKLVTNWVLAHLTFVDFCAKLSIAEVKETFKKDTWKALKQHVLKDLSRYFGRRRFDWSVEKIFR
jgi:Putative amidoligase enzyme